MNRNDKQTSFISLFKPLKQLTIYQLKIIML